MLFVGAVTASVTLNFLPQLVTWYKEIKERDDNFDVIYISRDKDEDTFYDVFRKMPWLTFPYGLHYDYRPTAILDDVDEMYNYFDSCYLFAFGEDGRVVSKDAARHLRSKGADAYPFENDDELLDDVKLQLAERFVWGDKDKDGRSFSVPCSCPHPLPRYSRRYVDWQESEYVDWQESE